MNAASRTRSLLRSIARRGRGAERRWLLALSLGAIATLALIAWFPMVIPPTALIVPMFLGSLVLGPRRLPWLVALVMALAIGSLFYQPDIPPRIYTAVVITLLVGGIVLVSSYRRLRLGVAGVAGESMLVDLRDRIGAHSGIPKLPPGWTVEQALRSAGGTPFAGDFVVASRPEHDRLELAVVDVSGKGEEAGTRALLLSGAFGGLLGALPPDQFLPAANAYLLRQSWEEGFATAVHLSLDLGTGSFEVRSAGHPPPVVRAAGSGRWLVLGVEGPALGLIHDAKFAPVAGVLGPGDGMLLYTDGMVEEPRRDIDLGIDRMLGRAEGLLRGDFQRGATRLVDALGSKADDRAMVVVSRS